jgi:predicted metalloprotease
MRWSPRGPSENVEDRRGDAPASFGTRGRLGLGGFLVLLVLSLVFHKDFFALLGSSGNGPNTIQVDRPLPVPPASAEEQKLVQFVSFVLDDTQASWKQILPTQGTTYRDAKLVLFRDAIESACGFAEGASGPFYCPTDEKVYIDLGFYDELRDRFGAPGDFAQAYVIAHEIGHHVQEQLGTMQRVQRARAASPDLANELSVRLELQADCYAGIWGHAAAQRGILEPGDLEEGIGAAAAIGDDRIQKMTRGRVSPESFTHGTSAQRVEWLRRGLQSGRCEECDTFAGMPR